MLRCALAAVFAFAVIALGGVSSTRAEDKKDEKKTLEGTLTCTKCALKETDKCGHALVVKEGDKKVTYYLDDKGKDEKYHSQVCTEDKDAKVTGKIVEKDKKKWIEEPKVEIKK
jgi:hypothetical protein